MTMQAGWCRLSGSIGRTVSVSTTLGPGAAVGKYTVIRELGRGGMGVVYLAEDTTLSREVALKVLYPSLSTDTVFVDRFKQEARVVAAILHPKIVRINSFETLPEGLAIDMEYVAGPSLGHMMAHEVFTPQLAVQIARDTLEGLAVCHELGVVHRDIKPNNILLSTDGNAKLADFGLATAYATHLESSIYRMSSSGFFMGTPRFAPPEAWEGGHPLPNWDLYSLGLVLYEGLLGRPVYTGTTPLAIVKQLMANPIEPLRSAVPAISPELGAFVDRLVTHDPSGRPADAPEALRELTSLPEFKDAGGDRAPTVQMAVRSVRRKSAASRWVRYLRTGLVRGAAVVTLAAVGAAATLWFVRDTRIGDTAAARGPAPVPVRASATQKQLAKDRVMSAQDVLDSPKTEQSRTARMYTAAYMKPGETSKTEQRKERWMIMPGKDGGARRVFGMSDRFLMVAELADTPGGGVTFKGNWARYGLDFGAGFQEGTVEGAGTWMVPGTAMNLPLRMVNVRDHTEESFGVAVTEDASLKSDSHFIYELERTPLLQSLLFAEMVPRRTTWAASVIELLPCVYGAACTVPILADAAPAKADGILDEPCWSRTYFDASGRIGAMQGYPENSGAELKSVVNGQELLLALSCPETLSGRWGVRMTLMPFVGGPMPSQTYMKIVRYVGGPIEHHQYRAGVETAWDNFDWSLELGASGGRACCELSIPLASLKPSVRPSEFAVWRINAWIVAGESGQNESQVAAWGFPDLAAVEHGALLRFASHVQ